MKVMSLLSSILLAILIRGLISENLLGCDGNWEKFKATYNRNYSNETEKERMQIFLNNCRFINDKNEEFEKARDKFRLKMNKFGDWNSEEIKHLFFEPNECAPLGNKKMPAYNGDFDDKNIGCEKNWTKPFNWTEYGAVYEVEDQEKCAKGWAYSAIDSMRGRYFVLINNASKDPSKCVTSPASIETCKKVSPLSVEYVSKCTPGPHNNNCTCGYSVNVFTYAVNKNRGIPYKTDWNATWKCSNRGNNTNDPFKIKSFDRSYDIVKNKCRISTIELKKGPMPVIINVSVSNLNFLFANTGVYKEEKCVGDLKHEVLLVGYGIENETRYWLVKNSFGTSWGDYGYLKIYAKDDNEADVCTPLAKVTIPELIRN